MVDEIEYFVESAGRLHDLAFPIRTSNVEACGKRVGPDIGASWVTERNLRAWPSERLDVAKRHFGVSRRPVLLHVVEGGPGSAAGLRRWDKIIAVAGEPLPVDGGGRSDIARMLESGTQGASVEITYERDGETASGTLVPVAACDIQVVLVDDDEANAFADRRNVYITTDFYRTETDSTWPWRPGGDSGVQTVIAHQMAHILKGHVRSVENREAIGEALDFSVTIVGNMLLLVGAAFGEGAGPSGGPFHTGGLFKAIAGRMFAHGHEREADELSLTMLERAGVPAEAAIEFWRDLAATPAELSAFAERHPVNEERLGILDARRAGVHGGDESPKRSAPDG